ncbi:MAG: hypothetical protein SGPRY_005946 [Prymnesium sp.]
MLADGCRHVFLDVGSNRGVHIRFLSPPHLFPSSTYLSRAFFSSSFGPAFHSDPSVCAFAFEPNPSHAPRLERLSRALRAEGRRVEWFPLAAAGGGEGRGGVVTMYHHRGDAAASDWRFGSKRVSHRPINVSSLDLGEFVLTELTRRAVPRATGRRGERPPSIVMKLDIEGDEARTPPLPPPLPSPAERTFSFQRRPPRLPSHLVPAFLI